MNQDAKHILDAALRDALPGAAVGQALDQIAFQPGGRLILVAAGKAAWEMARAAHERLGGRIDAGVVVTKYDYSRGPLGSLEIYEAGHPVPDENSYRATARALEVVSGLTEADSVLLLDAVCGAPMVLARAGVNPQHMSLDESGEVLAVAAGESGEVLLLSARSLALLRRLPMPGIVLDVALRAGAVYALCLNETLNSTLVTIPRAGARQVLSLSGMPGRIACERGDVICATEGFLHTVSMDGMRLLDTRRVSGRASIWLTAGETLLLCDALSECIFARNGGGQWSLFCEHARDMRFLFGKG